LFEGIVQRFNEKFKGKYEIVIEDVPGDHAYIEKLKMLNAADELPVLFDLGYDPSLAQMIIENDKVVDLKPYIDADPQWRSVLLDESIEKCTVNGKIVSAPLYLDTFSGLFYNKELFTKAGINEFPKTWDGFLEACKKLKDNGITPISLHTTETGWCAMLVFTAKVASYSQEGLEFPTDFNKPYIIDAAKFVQELFSYSTSDAVGGNYAMAANNFVSGKTAMIPNGPWMINTFTDPKTAPEGFDKKVGVALYPGNLAHASLARYGIAVAKRFPKEVQEGAIEYLRFAATPEEIRIDCVMNGRVAPKVSLTDEDKKKLNELQVESYNVMQQVKTIVPNYQYRWDTAVQNDAIPKELPLLATGKITPEEFAQRLTDTAKQFAEQSK